MTTTTINVSAHCRPTVNSSGAASGGPMIMALASVACAIPDAFARSASPVTMSLSSVNRAGMKNRATAAFRKTKR